MAATIGVDCAIKGAKCYLAACCSSGECKRAQIAANRIAGAAAPQPQGPATIKMHDLKPDPTQNICVDCSKLLQFCACDPGLRTGIRPVGQQQAAPAPAMPQCHYGLYPLGAIGKARLWVGREAAVCEQIKGQPAPVQLVINCAGDMPWGRKSEPVGVVTGNKGAKRLLPPSLFREHEPAPQVVIDWPDYGVPELDRAWWVRLNAALRKIGGDVILHCLGGHGRTGTAASILAVLNGWSGGECPVTWLRGTYCHEAVECEEQIYYIEQIARCTVKAKPAKVWSDYAATHSGTTGDGTWRRNLPTITHGAGKPPTMSLRKYRKWAREEWKLYSRPNPSVKELTSSPHKQILLIAGEWYMFDPKDKTFTFKANVARHVT